MPRRFSESEKRLIRKRLLSQGYRQFSAYGLRKTNIQELAQGARISKGAFYRFYESKEALFMDVAEMAEERYRQDILAVIGMPGPSPRARLLAVFTKAFDLLRTIPVLRYFTSRDYDLLLRRMPAEKLQEHLASDRAFFQELVTRCQKAGIPVRARPEEISGLLYPLVLTFVHEDDLGRDTFGGSTDLLLELVAAYCLGEVEIQPQEPLSPAPDPQRRIIA
jgi:AcrR family transcriptional regulator